MVVSVSRTSEAVELSVLQKFVHFDSAIEKCKVGSAETASGHLLSQEECITFGRYFATKSDFAEGGRHSSDK